jgi:hypothetical protein
MILQVQKEIGENCIAATTADLSLPGECKVRNANPQQ